MKRKIRMLALCLALVFLLSGCGVPDEVFDAILEQIDASGSDIYRASSVPFDQISYARPDPEELGKLAGQAASLAEDNKPAEQIIEVLQQCDQMYYTAATMYSYAEIRYYQDLTDLYWAEEYGVCSDYFLECEILMDGLYQACARSPAAEVLEKEYFGEGFVDYYGVDYIGYTDETYSAFLAQEQELLNTYWEVTADPVIELDGKEISYNDALVDLSISDEEFERVQMAYYEQYVPVIGDIYIELVNLRNDMAAYCGYDSYEEYAYELVFGRDYEPASVDTLLQDIRLHMVPLYRELNVSELQQQVAYSAMNSLRLVRLMREAAGRMGGTIDETWDFLETNKLYDVEISADKADFSFQTYLIDYEAPFAFIKTWGTSNDLLGLSHEFGHCVDSFENYNGTYSIELNEVFSQAMEFLTICYLDDEMLQQELTEMKLLNLMDTYVQQASFVEFERRVYALDEDELNLEAIHEISLSTAEEYGYLIEGLEEYYTYSWVDITHFLIQPYYTISYLLSADAAFQIYQAELKETGAGLAVFNRLLPREYDGFFDTIRQQSDLQDPLSAGRMESTAATIREFMN